MTVASPYILRQHRFALSDVEIALTEAHPVGHGGGVPRSGEDTLPTVLLVHGWGHSGDGFAGLLRAIAGRFRVLVPDLRGHGRSGVALGPHAMPEMAGDLVAVLDLLGIEKVVAVGHSMGGQVASLFAIEHRDRAVAVAVLDPAYGADAAEMADLPQARRLLLAQGAQGAADRLGPGFEADSTDQWRRQVHAQLAATPLRVLDESRRSMYARPDSFGSAEAARRVLADRRVPVLGMYSTAVAAAFEASLPQPGGVRIQQSPGPGHYLHLEHPRWAADALREWLEDLTSPDCR